MNIYQLQPYRIFIDYVSFDEYEEIKNGTKKFIGHYDTVHLDVIDNSNVNVLFGIIGINGRPHTKNGIINYAYYFERQRGRPGVFATNDLSFYEIIDFIFTIEGTVQIKLLRINNIESVKKDMDPNQETIIPKKKRTQVPAKTRALLQKEINSKCPFCNSGDVDHFEIHHIDEDRSNNDFLNLLMVCPTCHSKITKKSISKDEVIAMKRSLLNNTKLDEQEISPGKQIKIKGNVTKSLIANTVTAQQIVFKGKSKPKILPHPDSIEANLIMKNYVKHLIDRYQEFIKDDHYKGEKRFAQIWGAIKREFGTDAYKIHQSRFYDLIAYLQKRINDTRIGRINNSRGQKLYSTFEEYKEKYN